MSDTAAAAGEAAQPSPKRVKSQPPDVVVVVGQGDAQVEFECYSTLLSFASEVFDTMLSTDMKEKRTHRIDLPDKNPEEWKMFYDFIEDRNAKVEARERSGVRPSVILSETKERARLLLPWFHEFQMTALVEECDDVLQRELLSFSKGEDYSRMKKFWLRKGESHHHEKKRAEMFQLCHEMLSMSYVYDLPKTQHHVANTLCFAVEFGRDLFDIDALKNIISLLKNSSNDISRHSLFGKLCEYLPDEITKNREECLGGNDIMLPYLIHAGMREKTNKNELKDAKRELQRAINDLPNYLYHNLPNTRRMPADTEDKIGDAAKRELEGIIYDWWGNRRSLVAVPPHYR